MIENLDISFSAQWMLYLLPLLGFLLGYAVTRRRIRRQKRKLRFSNDYFQGLNYLLNDQQDEALDIFIRLVETDWETIDTSLALGGIFRRKGEIDKAIKLHQNLLARPSLPAEYKSTVLAALANDYLHAGWLDRAEGLFKELIEDPEFTEEAQKCLMSIYQQEQEWEQAISIVKRYQRRGNVKQSPVVAQYYCELSDKMIQKNDYNEAEILAEKALSVDKDCVRASIILADIAINRGRFQKAIRFLRQVEIQNPQFIPVILDKLIMAYRNTSNLSKALSYIKTLDSKYPEISLVPEMTKLIDEIYGKQDAIQYLSETLSKRPSLSSLKTLLALQDSEVDISSQMLPTVIQAITDKQQAYQCCNCGYSANTHVWLCPSCHSWSTMLPKID